MDDDYINHIINPLIEYYRNHRGFISHHDISSYFSHESGEDEEGLEATDFSISVAVRMRELGWVETRDGNGYEFPEEEKPYTEPSSEDVQRAKTQAQIRSMLGIEAGAHDWRF